MHSRNPLPTRLWYLRLWRAFCWMATLLVAVAPLFSVASAQAELYINEIYFDPPGFQGDRLHEYIEIRGTPGMSLDNHFLIFLENENRIDNTGTPGQIENIFTFGDDKNTQEAETPYAIGANGFLTIRMKGNSYNSPQLGTTDLVNTGTGEGYGSKLGSTVRHQDQGDDGVTENSGFTAMLIRNDGSPNFNAPVLGMDLDVGNDGLDDASNDQFNWNDHWVILDSIGVFGEPGEAALGRTYAQVNFGPEIPGQLVDIGLEDPIPFVPNIEPGATYVGVGYEIEYLGRWGNSTGHTPDDWHASNLTANPLTGSTGEPDFRQSGGLHDEDEPDTRVETNQGVAYGTPLTNTLGAPNLFYEDGDFDLDGDVDGVDFLVWQRNLGFGGGIGFNTGDTALRTHGDTNGDWVVNGLDLVDWETNYGTTSSLAAINTVPEPSSAILSLLTCTLLATRSRSPVNPKL